MKMLQMVADANFHYLHALVAVPSLASPSFFRRAQALQPGTCAKSRRSVLLCRASMTIYPDTCFLKIIYVTYVSYVSYVYTLYALAYELLNPTVHMWHSSTHLILSHWMPAQQWLRPPRGSFPASCGDAPRPVPAASHVPRRHRYITQAQRNSI